MDRISVGFSEAMCQCDKHYRFAFNWRWLQSWLDNCTLFTGMKVTVKMRKNERCLYLQVLKTNPECNEAHEQKNAKNIDTCKL